jgi:hypothetical protein
MVLYHALKTLYPQVKNDVGYCHITNRGGVDVIDYFNEEELGTKPTQEELKAAFSEYETKEYARKRAVEYPALNEQLDMLWHAIDEGKLNKYSDFYKTLKSVKDKYPKSGE